MNLNLYINELIKNNNIKNISTIENYEPNIELNCNIISCDDLKMSNMINCFDTDLLLLNNIHKYNNFHPIVEMTGFEKKVLDEYNEYTIYFCLCYFIHLLKLTKCKYLMFLSDNENSFLDKISILNKVKINNIFVYYNQLDYENNVLYLASFYRMRKQFWLRQPIYCDINSIIHKINQFQIIDIIDLLSIFKNTIKNNKYKMIIIEYINSNQHTFTTKKVKKYYFKNSWRSQFIKYLKNFNIPIIGFFNNDILSGQFVGGYSGLSKLCNNLNIKHIICAQKGGIKQLIDIKQIMPKINLYIRYPYGIDTGFYKNHNNNRQFDLFISGAITHFYKLRKYFVNKHILTELADNNIKILLLYNKTFGSKQDFNHKNITIINHIYGKGYINYINKCKVGFCGSLNWSGDKEINKVNSMCIAKYFEYSACGTAILGDMCSFGETFFGENYYHMDINMTQDEIINKVINIFKKPEDIKNKAEIMYNKVHNELNLDKNYEKLSNIINKIGNIEFNNDII